MPEEKISFPLKPWQKAIINAFLVAGIASLSTVISMTATGDIWDSSNPHIFHSIILSAVLSGSMTLMVQVQSLFQKDLSEDEQGKSFTPLMFIK